MDVIELMLLFLLLVCGIATCLSRNLLVSLVIFMAYSVMMSIVWVLLQAPDLAITEAAVGAGVSMRFALNSSSLTPAQLSTSAKVPVTCPAWIVSLTASARPSMGMESP